MRKENGIGANGSINRNTANNKHRHTRHIILINFVSTREKLYRKWRSEKNKKSWERKFLCTFVPMFRARNGYWQMASGTNLQFDTLWNYSFVSSMCSFLSSSLTFDISDCGCANALHPKKRNVWTATKAYTLIFRGRRNVQVVECWKMAERRHFLRVSSQLEEVL